MARQTRKTQAHASEDRVVTDPKMLIAQGWLDTLTFLRDQKGAEMVITKGRSGIDIKATFPKIMDDNGRTLMISAHPYSGRVQAVWYDANNRTYSEPTYFGNVSVWNVGVNKDGHIVRIPQDFEQEAQPEAASSKIPF